MLEVPYLPPQMPYEADYSGRFTATGVILLLVAAVTGCFTALLPFGYVMQQRMAPGQAPPLSQFVIAVAMYLALTVATGWLGVAALMKHRYVRPLVMIFSTHMLLLGVVTLLATVFLMPTFKSQFQQAAGPGASSMPAVVGMIIGMAMVFLFLVVPPVVLLLLMRPPAVQVTAERYDLRPRWTDGVPMKVLGLVVTLAVFAASEVLLLGRPMVPVFVRFVTGVPAILLILAHVALLTWAAVRIYRRDLFGWRLAFWALVVPLTIFTISTLTMPTDRYIATIQDQPGMPELIAKHEGLFRTLWITLSALFLVSTVIYLLRLRPLIEPGADEADASMPAALPSE